MLMAQSLMLMGECCQGSLKMKKYFVFITVREESSRLKKKCMKRFGSKASVLDWVHSRLKINPIFTPIICTGDSKKNENVINFALNNNIHYFSGPEDNKIKRWYECARYFKIESFHTLDCDDPFFDPQRIIQSMALLQKEDVEVILPSDYSDNGAATEGFSIKTTALEFSAELENSANTEMCYSYFKDQLNSILLPNPLYAIDRIRMTLDYEDDYKFLNNLANILDSDTSREFVEEYLSKNYKETPNFNVNSLWKANQNNVTEETYENFSRTK